MPKPSLTGNVARSLFERIAQEAHDGKTEALDGLFLMLGDDTKGAIANQKSVIERLELIEQLMNRMSNLQITQANDLLLKGTDK